MHGGQVVAPGGVAGKHQRANVRHRHLAAGSDGLRGAHDDAVPHVGDVRVWGARVVEVRQICGTCSLKQVMLNARQDACLQQNVQHACSTLNL